MVAEAGKSPRSGCVEELDDSHVTVKFPKEDENRWTPLLFSGERKTFSIHDRNAIALERDFVLLHDNFKTIWGPPDLIFQDHQFGVRFMKRKQPVIEFGVQLDLSPKFSDPLVVIGVVHQYQKTNRKTSVQLVLYRQKRMELQFLEYSIFSKLFAEDRTRILESTPESRGQASEGRHLMSVVANGTVAPPSISEDEIYGSVVRKTASRAKRVSQKEPQPQGKLCFSLKLATFLFFSENHFLSFTHLSPNS